VLCSVVSWFPSALIVERLRKVSGKVVILVFAFEDCSRRIRCMLCESLVIVKLVSFFRGEGRGNM